MAKYTITYLGYPSADSNDAVLTLVNQLPSPLPSSGNWTAYKHAGKTVLEISTEDADAKILITPPTGGSLSDQNVKALLGVASGQETQCSWTVSGGGVELAMSGDATSTTFDVTDSSLPVQRLKVVVRRPV